MPCFAQRCIATNKSTESHAAVNNQEPIRRRLKHTWCRNGSLAGAASWGEDAEVVEPGTAVELGVDGLNEPWLLRVWVRVRLGLHDDDPLDLLLRGGNSAGG